MTPTTRDHDWLDAFIRRHRLPAAYRASAHAHFLPLARFIAARRRAAGQTVIVGISGAQGTGKTTLADCLAQALGRDEGLSSVVVSLDDFYLGRADRERLADEVHPLLTTRGAAGTHDVEWLARSLDRLRALPADDSIPLPRFDKARDDRAPESDWRRVTGPVDIVLFEGWLVGARPLAASALRAPINALERDEDPDGRWRHYVNDRLATEYAALFRHIDALVFLAAPDFDAVFRWRLAQERRLAARRDGDAIMDAAGVARFLQFFERVTRDNLERLPEVADAVLTLDAAHRCVSHRF